MAPPLPPSALVRPEIARLSGYVPGEQPQSGKWIKLNTNENAGRTLAKYPDPLATVFRMRAAEVLGVSPDWILCGNGSDDLLTILVRTFVGAGEWLRMPYPSYILYRTLAGIQGSHCDEVHYNPDWSLDDSFAAPRTTDGKEIKLAIIANPNSPSGTLLPPARGATLADRLSCAVVVD
ncbi:MAG: aminotransferase class I/II-fold pyridoxal phosphate-dependent enzyme, partial [Planctomycetia bacterium]|nr:aminotransferase class I/II-fold pyridoxal phosphate-dependent enzyme [Planctomycetia bacterium]